jgi:hypothetical protein
MDILDHCMAILGHLGPSNFGPERQQPCQKEAGLIV